MSYILDALRKADAERERGQVPGIHAQPIFAGAPASAAARRGVPVWAWIGAAVLVLLLVAVSGWAWLASAPSTPPAVTSAVPPPIAAAAPRSLPAPASASVPAPVATAPPAAPITAAPVVRKPAAAAPPKPVAVAEARPLAAPDAPASAKAADAYDENRVYAQRDLPEEIRRQLPAVNVGGSMYSAKKADRLLIINGQVLHEGDAIAPGLMLEQIRLKAAVLAFKGYRYAIAF